MTTNQRTRTPRASLPLLLLLAAACGNLDERDTDPPAVRALARWDATHVLALRTYDKEAAVVDLASGRVTEKVKLDKYYNDIRELGGGRFVAAHNQSIDFVGSDGRLEPGRSIAADLVGGIAVSSDHATLAYSKYLDSVRSSLVVLSLQEGVTRVPPPGVISPFVFDLSRSGDLLAFDFEGNVNVVNTTDPSQTASTCELSPSNPDSPGAAQALAFSPAEDKLAVGTLVGDVQIFAPSTATGCASLVAIPTPDPSTPPELVRFSPSGETLAVASTRGIYNAKGQTLSSVTAIRLYDVSTGGLLTQLDAYPWQRPAGDATYIALAITDMQWTDAGDGLILAASGGPLQYWDVATRAMRWELKL